jgi:hypothetical protein
MENLLFGIRCLILFRDIGRKSGIGLQGENVEKGLKIPGFIGCYGA